MASALDVSVNVVAAGDGEEVASSFDKEELMRAFDHHHQGLLGSHSPYLHALIRGPDTDHDPRSLVCDEDVNLVADPVATNDIARDFKSSDGLQNEIGEVILSYERSLELEVNSCTLSVGRHSASEELVHCLDFDGAGSDGSTGGSSLLPEEMMSEIKGVECMLNLFSDAKETAAGIRGVICGTHIASSKSDPANIHPSNTTPQSVDDSVRLRDWERRNALYLEYKQRKEREKLSRIIDDADEYKENFYVNQENLCEEAKKINREKQKAFLANQEIFYATAHKHYWKAVSELILNSELSLADSNGRDLGKDQQKKQCHMILKVEGPKPGKATELTRMLEVILKLKHNIPAYIQAAAGLQSAYSTKHYKPT
ncbi:hypothetical protein O6H91_04G058800 [Diphasiastrum complanatum]|uniref:Uncharacterized protein n=2 Tax=Diphasiastrum complanatum TaxID=34168 RepID=A0ACC2DX64_DIPCM|nr:hypothetical protein O6H91_04G058800 [Diphasiastrum complanatum]KAJ7558855.1 hypothetical protein O6H91_04G058800 [Diphasiastrum complanatum]